MAKIKVAQAEVNTFFEEVLYEGENYLFADLKGKLQSRFPGINDNQCSGVIYRAYYNEKGVLEKHDNLYCLRSSIGSSQVQLEGLEKVKAQIGKLVQEISEIPAGEFVTVEDFKRFKEIRETLLKLKE